MSDFDSTDFDSTSNDEVKCNATPGNFTYPIYIEMTQPKELFCEEEMSYREKQMNLLIRDKNASTENDKIERENETKTAAESHDKEIEAPFAYQRSGVELLIKYLENSSEMVESNGCASEIMISSSSFIEKQGKIIFDAFRVEDFTLYESMLYIAGDFGDIAVFDCEDNQLIKQLNCGRAILNICIIEGEIIILTRDGCLCKITSLENEIILRDKEYIKLFKRGKFYYVETISGKFLEFDTIEQLRDGCATQKLEIE